MATINAERSRQLPFGLLRTGFCMVVRLMAVNLHRISGELGKEYPRKSEHDRKISPGPCKCDPLHNAKIEQARINEYSSGNCERRAENQDCRKCSCVG